MLNLDKEEKVLLEVRKHWFVFFAEGFFLALAAIIPVIFYKTFTSLIPISLGMTTNVSALAIFLYSIWVLILWIAFFVQWTNYYLDVWYVTQKRIIDVEQRRLFHREVSSIRFDKIQDITVEVKGILATFLNIGNIKVQTAGENSQDFIMNSADAPDRVREIVFSRHNVEAEKTRPVHIVNENGHTHSDTTK
jgi:hypothetical protein